HALGRPCPDEAGSAGAESIGGRAVRRLLAGSHLPPRKLIYRVADMESQSVNSDPDGRGWDPATARAPMSSLDADSANLADRVVTRWWYHLSLGGVVACCVLAQLFPSPASVAIPALGIIAFVGLDRAYSSRYGVTINRPVGRRSAFRLGLVVATVVAALAASLVMGIVGVSPWWVSGLAVCSMAATVGLGI